VKAPHIALSVLVFTLTMFVPRAEEHSANHTRFSRARISIVIDTA
jgi:hypothetical protein